MRGGKGKVLRWPKGGGQVGNIRVGKWEIKQKRMGKWSWQKGDGQWIKGMGSG